MNQKIIELSKPIFEEINKAKNILLVCHRSPDADSLGSTLALHYYLKSLGKKVTHISGDNALPKYLSSLPGYDLIEEKNFFEVDLSKIDLFIATDIGGLNQISRLKEVKFPENLKVVAIDHHRSNNGFGDIDLIDETAAAACQIVFYLFKEWGIKITPEMAINLFAGMYTDSGGFKYPLTTPDTFKAAAELVEINPEFYRFIFEIENSQDADYLKFQALGLSKIEPILNGQVAVSVISHEELLDSKLLTKEWNSSDIANSIKSVRGWEIGVCLTEKEVGVYGASFRSRDGRRYDVSKIASLLGGGGHAAASGAPILAKSTDEAKKQLSKAILKIYPEFLIQ